VLIGPSRKGPCPQIPCQASLGTFGLSQFHNSASLTGALHKGFMPYALGYAQLPMPCEDLNLPHELKSQLTAHSLRRKHFKILILTLTISSLRYQCLLTALFTISILYYIFQSDPAGS
jgi:hypothetical protein